MADSALSVIGAVKSALIADAPLSALIDGRVYTDVPQPPVFPYISFGPILSEPWDASCAGGSEMFVQIDTWSRKPGPAECLKIQAFIRDALHAASLGLSGHDHILMRVDSARYMRDRDNETHHGATRLRILTQKGD